MQKERELAEKAVTGSEADFAEIRLEKTKRTTVTQAGMNHSNTGPLERFTGTARVFVSGRWAVCEFNSAEEMHRSLDTAAAMAIESNSPVLPFPVLPPPAHDTYTELVAGIPLSDTPLREKSFLCKHYCELLGASLTTGSARVDYEEVIRDRVIVNKSGTSIREIEHLASLKTQAVLPGGFIAAEEFALRGTFDRFHGLEKHMEQIAGKLLVRTTTMSSQPGRTRVILDPELTGILVHEAFGHLAEADFLLNNPALGHILKPGAFVASDCVNIIDDALRMDMPGSMMWDDEGTPGQKTRLVSNGTIKNWLHTTETAARCDAEPTGNARVSIPGGIPEPRMSCTYMEPGKTSLENLKFHLDNGLYLKGFMGGATDMDRFSIAVQEAWLVRNGKITEPVTPVVMSGKVTDVFKSILDTGDDLKLTGRLAGCSRRIGGAIAVSYGGPHILIQDMQVT